MCVDRAVEESYLSNSGMDVNVTIIGSEPLVDALEHPRTAQEVKDYFRQRGYPQVDYYPDKRSAITNFFQLQLPVFCYFWADDQIYASIYDKNQ